MRTDFAICFGLLVCLLAAAPPLAGQAITAKVVGTVADPSGAAVPQATVSITNVATGQTRTTTTNDVGNYEFSFLPVGSYTMSVEKEGFQKTGVRQFRLSVDQVARVDVTLQVGQVTEVVEVAATAIGLQTEDATVGTVIDGQKVVELPLNGRSFVQLALLTPGVNPGTPRLHHGAPPPRSGRPGRRHVGQWGARHAEPFLLRRHRGHGSGQLQLQFLALGGRHPGVQGPGIPGF